MMLSRLGQTILVAAPSMAGEGLLERLRNATVAMLAAVAAVGLSLVVVASIQGWPTFTASPFPLLPIERVGEAQVAEEESGAIAVPAGSQGRIAGAPSASALSGSARPDSGARHGSEQPPQAVGPGVAGPYSPPAGQGAPTPPVAAPEAPSAAPAPAPVQPAPTAPSSAPPTTKSPGGGNGQAKGHEKNSVPAGGGQTKSAGQAKTTSQPSSSTSADLPPKSIPEGPAEEASPAPEDGGGPSKDSTSGAPKGKAPGHDG
jgi:hypothetical protein